MPYKNIGGGRFELGNPLSGDEIEALAADPLLRIVQFSHPLETTVFAKLELKLFSRRTDVELRAYGHYSVPCDLSFVRELPSLRRFCADCLTKVSELEALTELRFLQRVTIGIYSAQNFDFLETLPETLECLCLGPTKRKNIPIHAIGRFSQMSELVLCGHQNGLESVAKLGSLGQLGLNSMSSPDLGFLSKNLKLRTLSITLGGASDLLAIALCPGLKKLNLCWIRGLKDISFVSRCLQLESLVLDRLKQVTTLPSLEPLSMLRSVVLNSMRGLCNAGGLESGTFESLAWFDAKELEPEDFGRVLSKKSLKRVSVYFGSTKKNRRFDEMAKDRGLKEAPDWATALQ